MLRTTSEERISSIQKSREEHEQIDLLITRLNDLITNISNFFLTKAPNSTFGWMISNDLRVRVFNHKLNANREMTFNAVKTYLQGIHKNFSIFKKEEIKLLDELINFYLAIGEILNQLEAMKKSKIYLGLSDLGLNQHMQLVKNNLPSYIFKKDPWIELRELLVWEGTRLTDLKNISDDRDTVLRIKVEVKEAKEDEEEVRERSKRKKEDAKYIKGVIEKVNSSPPQPPEFHVNNPGTIGNFKNLVNDSQKRRMDSWEKALEEEEQKELAREKSSQPLITDTNEHEDEDRRSRPALPRRSNRTKYVIGILSAALVGAAVGGGLGALAGFASLGVGLIFTVPAGVVGGFVVGLIGGSIVSCCINQCCTDNEPDVPTQERAPVERHPRNDEENRPAASPQRVRQAPPPQAEATTAMTTGTTGTTGRKKSPPVQLSKSHNSFVRAPGAHPTTPSSLPSARAIENPTRAAFTRNS